MLIIHAALIIPIAVLRHLVGVAKPLQYSQAALRAARVVAARAVSLLQAAAHAAAILAVPTDAIRLTTT